MTGTDVGGEPQATETEAGPESGHRTRPGSWQARLALAFAHRENRTLLARMTHTGPLVVQKTLHPEGPAVCQAIIVHPPGGIAGGDELEMDIDVGEGATAQLTTPGAARWYGSASDGAQQTITASVGRGAVLEWLPQENIVYNGARAGLATRIVLAEDATFVGWDVACLGRTASGEQFDRGVYRQCLEVVCGDTLVWTERTIIDASTAIMTSRVALNGCPMFGTFVAAAPIISDNLLAQCRAIAASAPQGIECSVTRLPGILVARCLGGSAEEARRCFASLWAAARPALCNRQALAPRIWNT